MSILALPKKLQCAWFGTITLSPNHINFRTLFHTPSDLYKYGYIIWLHFIYFKFTNTILYHNFVVIDGLWASFLISIPSLPPLFGLELEALNHIFWLIYEQGFGLNSTIGRHTNSFGRHTRGRQHHCAGRVMDPVMRRAGIWFLADAKHEVLRKGFSGSFLQITPVCCAIEEIGSGVFQLLLFMTSSSLKSSSPMLTNPALLKFS